MTVSVYQTVAGSVNLHWQLDEAALYQAQQKGGRYLLVTNDWSLSHQEMFRLYRQKDGVEKRFTICKSDLKVSPLYLHQDQRIAAMLFLNRVALLAYSLLERQGRQHRLQLTTRQLIKRLETLTLIATPCRDGSCLWRLTPLEPEMAAILQRVAQALDELFATLAMRHMPLLPARPQPPPLSPPPLPMVRLCCLDRPWPHCVC